MNAQKIVKGDDTYFNSIDLLGSIELQTALPLVGWSARFTLQKVTLTFNDITSKVIQPRFTKEQTQKFCLGPCNAKLELFDDVNNKRTQFTDLPYEVVEVVKGDYNEQ